jgi:hypothetical protein
MEKELIDLALRKVAKRYTDSPATTNLGLVGRFLVRMFPPSLIVKMFAHKLGKV